MEVKGDVNSRVEGVLGRGRKRGRAHARDSKERKREMIQPN
jgi:hypothetical protein